MLEKYVHWLKTEGKSQKTINEYPVILKKLIKWYEETEGYAVYRLAVWGI